MVVVRIVNGDGDGEGRAGCNTWEPRIIGTTARDTGGSRVIRQFLSSKTLSRLIFCSRVLGLRILV